jgi:HD superfamily phosphodiesterase
VIFAAAYLHDMGAVSAFAEPKKEHADVGAAKIDIVLAKTDFLAAKLDAVRAAIRTHNPDRNPVSAEARYLHDADILDNLGASGWAWALELVDKKGANPRVPRWPGVSPIRQCWRRAW